jgi:hypothetical protein
MRELWATGYIPNYIRHVVAGFLVEYMNCDWRHGALWFHDTLCDADLAINSSMWQVGAAGRAAAACRAGGRRAGWLAEAAASPVAHPAWAGRAAAVCCVGAGGRRIAPGCSRPLHVQAGAFVSRCQAPLCIDDST